MYYFRSFFILTFFLISGCGASLVKYKPSDSPNIQQALINLESTINNNPDGKSISLQFANERVMKIIGRLEERRRKNTILYQSIGKIELYNKRGLYIICIRDKKNKIDARLYTKSESDAKQLMNALHTLRMQKMSPDKKYMTQITVGGDISQIAIPSYIRR